MTNRTPFLTIRAEGALLPVDLLQRIVGNDRDLGGLTPESYHLSGEKLNEAINRSWNRLLGAWAAFRVAREKLPEGDAGTSVTREKWLLPLFDELDYGRLQITKAIDIEGKSYAISHGWNEVPIHLVGCGAELDRRTAGVAGAAKASPHSLVQELLNRSPERTWGFVSNGLRMRVLRDNASLTRQAYLEFDLEAMMNGEVYADFVVLWLVCHESRLEPLGIGNRDSGVGTSNSPLPTPDCHLEQWSKVAQERGTRALDGLRVGVEKAIEALGKGFIAQPANGSLRSALSSGAVSTLDLYRQLLRLVYRLIFLFVAEDRQLLRSPASDAESWKRYVDYYSTARLRRMAERVRGSRHADLYAALKLVMDEVGGVGNRQLGNRESGVESSSSTAHSPFPIPANPLGLFTLGGFLFSRDSIGMLADCELSNAALLDAVRSLAFSQDGRVRRAVDYKNLGSEELGSIYESLLELHPLVNTDAATFELTAVSGSERKTTGSYYTPSSLIQVLLDSALEPVIERVISEQSSVNSKNTLITDNWSLRTEQAILNLKVVDPACGSGHFLVAAAHRLARRLATVRTGEGEPAPEAMRSALRSVISNCIYGVDINPMSVELCKVSLWMEALEPGKPLSFLDAHIQCGDSLVGVGPRMGKGVGNREVGSETTPHSLLTIPDEAFNPAFGDDKVTASALKKRNKRERTGQLGFRFEVTHMTSMDDLARWLAERAEQVDAMPEDDSNQVGAKAKAFDDYHATSEYLKNRFELDLWTAAFFWKIPKADGETMLAPTQQELIQLRNGGELDSRLVERVKEISEHLNFFHWELAFPKVFSGNNPGFDCVLGNPPWEMMQLDPQEFFATSNPEVAKALNLSAREKLIEKLADENSDLYNLYTTAVHDTEALQKFTHSSNRFPLTSYGRVNLMALFAELSKQLINANGQLGLILPLGIATDSFNQFFFSDLVRKKSLVRILGFENESFIFFAVHHAFKFCLLTISGENLKVDVSDFVFFCRSVDQIKQPERHFQLSKSDFELLNPNSETCPIFRTAQDAELTKKAYRNAPILQNDKLDESPWGFKGMLMFMMSSDSHLFSNEPREGYLPLYEAKLMHQFDHRWATYEGATKEDIRKGLARDFDLIEKSNPAIQPLTRYWVPETNVNEKLKNWKSNWLICFRDITSSVVERTAIFTIIPKLGVGNTAPIMLIDPAHQHLSLCLLGCLNSLVFDFVTRQKVGGIHLTFMYLKQLPVLPPSAYTPADIDFIAPRVLELVYTANDLRPFAEDMWGAGVGNSEIGSRETAVGSSSTAYSPFPTARKLLIKQWEKNYGHSIYSILPRLASLAGSNESGGNVLSPDQSVSKGRDVRHDESDSTGRSVSPSEHSGGLREGESGRLHSLSANSTGFSERNGDSSNSFNTSRTYDERVYRAIADAMRDGWKDFEGANSVATEREVGTQGVGNRELGVETIANSPFAIAFMDFLLTTPDAPLPLPPFRWNEIRRAQIRAELDAYYARLYGLTRAELR